MANQVKAMLAPSELAGSQRSYTTSVNGTNQNGEDAVSQLLLALVRRFMLLGRVSANEWSRYEAALIVLSRSILNRYFLQSITAF